MSHKHLHQPVSSGTRSLSLLLFCIVINLLFVAAEAVAGRFSNSSALLSDAGHNLSDVLGLLLSFIAIALGRRNGMRGISKLATLANGALLLVTVVIIGIESARSLMAPSEVAGEAVVATAVAGILVNGLTVWLLMKNGNGNINLKVAYLHALTDMLVSVGVVLSGVVVYFTGLDIVDPLVSICVSASVLVAAVKLIANALRKADNS